MCVTPGGHFSFTSMLSRSSPSCSLPHHQHVLSPITSMLSPPSPACSLPHHQHALSLITSMLSPPSPACSLPHHQHALGAFWGGRGQQKLLFLMEGLSNIEVPRFARGSSRQLRQLPEVSHGPQLRATDPHAPGAKMT